MSTIHLESLSSFGRLAVKLDGEFTELTRLSGQLERLDLESDSGLDRAVKLLDQFAQNGKNIAEGIQEFSKVLNEAHTQAGNATTIVAKRAEIIGQRKKEQNLLGEKLFALQEEVKAANSNLTGF